MGDTFRIYRAGLSAAILLSAISAAGAASAQTMVQVQNAKDSASCVAAAKAMPAARVSVGLDYCQQAFSQAAATPPQAATLSPVAPTPQGVKVTGVNQSVTQVPVSTNTAVPPTTGVLR